jgi:Fe-S-cluster-containing dehydrogenase component
MSQIENKEFTGPSNLSALDRRDFMKYMGLFSSMTLLSSCSQKADHIVPYAKEVAEFSEKNYEFYQTAFSDHGFAQGISVKSFQGRPIKIDGNPLHPYSLGATTPEAQATLYELYHPERVQDIKWKGKTLSRAAFTEELQKEMAQWGTGEGVVIFYRPDHSPTQIDLIQNLLKRYPRLHVLSISKWKQTSTALFDLDQADLVVSFDEDLFFQRPDALLHSRTFMGRRVEAIRSNQAQHLNRLEVYESSPTLLGAKADHTEILRPEEIWNDACDLLELMRGKSVSNPRMLRLKSLMEGKKTHVSVARHLSPEAQDLEMALNSTTDYRNVKHELPQTDEFSQIQTLVSQGKIHTIISLGENPFEEDLELKKVPLKISLSQFLTKTLALSDVQVGEAHFLETWGDLKAVNGDISIIQPLINPLYKTLSVLEFLMVMTRDSSRPLELLKKKYSAPWSEALQTGLIRSQEKLNPSPNGNKSFTKKSPTQNLILKIAADPSVGFGEHSDNPVLQELPKNFSKLTWQNAFHLSLETAKSLKIQDGDKIKISNGKATATGPVKILPGMASNLILATLGYGEDYGSFIKKKRGYSLKNFQEGDPIEVKKDLGSGKLAMTQETLFTPGQEPVKTSPFPIPAFTPKKPQPSLYPGHPLPHQDQGPQWGMTIDLTSCIGCQACVVSCQVENNIPFVGEEQVEKGRILHWLRIDTYRVNENTFFQPVPCMHCEKAPCEVVCPVNATVHGNGGLNEMIYNRCVGTRYCSNNCPYKVRKFNFGAYSTLKSPWNMGFNPEVSIRDRGVMEKCTYCIQKIKEGEHTGKAVTTACQNVCPTKAIEFGNIRDPGAQVSINKATSLNYDLLEEEGAVPRTSYLKVVRL